MQLIINGETHNFAPDTTIQEILEELKVRRDHGLAVALNNTVLSKSQFRKTRVNEGDSVEIIHAVAGG